MDDLYKKYSEATAEEMINLIQSDASMIKYIPDYLKKDKNFIIEAYNKNNLVYGVLKKLKLATDRLDEHDWEKTVSWYNDDINEAGFHFTSNWDFAIDPDSLLK